MVASLFSILINAQTRNMPLQP